MDTGRTWPLLLQHRTISFKLLAKSVNCLFARSPPCTKVCTKTSLSLYYTLCFCIKQYDFHLFIYSQPPVVCHFTNWWHLSHFPWTTAFTRTFATSILWCYNFNGMTFRAPPCKWRIFHRPLDLTPLFCDNVVKAWCILHNFIHWNNGFQLEETLYDSNVESMQATGTRGNIKGKHVRDYFAKYFTSPHGAVPWQYDAVSFGIWHSLKGIDLF